MLEKIYMKSSPTAMVWDQNEAFQGKSPSASNDDDDDDDMWEGMKRIGDMKPTNGAVLLV